MPISTVVKDLSASLGALNLSANDGNVRSKRKRNTDQICRSCSVGFDTPRDRTLLKDPSYQWIGCERENCLFWAHAACIGLDLKKRDPKNITYII